MTKLKLYTLKKRTPYQRFYSYEVIRRSGITNMWNIDLIKHLTHLTEKQIFSIMRNYRILSKKYEKELEADNQLINDEAKDVRYLYQEIGGLK